MALLSDLPREIILNIADRLDYAGTNALARTNKQIYRFVNRYLYCLDVTNKSQSRSLIWAIENHKLRVEATSNGR
jgi:F-box associated protein